MTGWPQACVGSPLVPMVPFGKGTQGGGGVLSDVALFPTQKVICTFSSQTFCERRLGPFRLLTSFFSPSCDLHVLPVVLISFQPTHT